MMIFKRTPPYTCLKDATSERFLTWGK